MIVGLLLVAALGCGGDPSAYDVDSDFADGKADNAFSNPLVVEFDDAPDNMGTPSRAPAVPPTTTDAATASGIVRRRPSTATPIDCENERPDYVSADLGLTWGSALTENEL